MQQLFKSHGEMAAKTDVHVRSNWFKKLHGRQGNEVVNLPSKEAVLAGFDLILKVYWSCVDNPGVI